MAFTSQLALPKKRAGDWACPNATCVNQTFFVFARRPTCPNCGTPKPTAPTVAYGDSRPGAGAPDDRFFQPNAGGGMCNGPGMMPPTGKGAKNGKHHWLPNGCSGFVAQYEPPPPYPKLETPVTQTDEEFRKAKVEPESSMWNCRKCGHANFKKDRFETSNSCRKCCAPRVENSDDAWHDMLSRNLKSSKGSSSRRRRSSSSSSVESSSSSSESDRRKKKKRKSKAKSRSRSKRRKHADATIVEEVLDSKAPVKTVESNPKIEAAKSDVLAQVMKLKDAGLEMEDQRRRWRLLLREWHPDKHEDKEVATAVFQFLQKAKTLLD